MSAERVEVVRMELQPSSGNHERTRYPTGLQPKNSLPGVNGVLNLASIQHAFDSIGILLDISQAEACATV